MRSVDPSAPPIEVLSAVNMASVWMGGAKDQFQSFCAGFASGISAALECLGVDYEQISPRILGDDEAVNRKIRAGGVAVIESYNEALTKDSIMEETDPVSMARRAELRNDILKTHAEYISKTVKSN